MDNHLLVNSQRSNKLRDLTQSIRSADTQQRGQPMTSKTDRRRREAFAVLSYSNMLTLNALIQLLTEKGVVTRKEIFDRVKQFEDQAKTARR